MSWKKIRILVPLASLLITSACMDPPQPAECPSGLICPPGTICDVERNTCISASCGDGIVDVHAGERCDDGNTIANDGCSANCTSDETCGNGILDEAQEEVCDDANESSEDGCSADCKSDETCGNGHVDPREACDEGGVNTPTCDADCTATSCGDEFVNPVAGELCDDGGESGTCVDCRLVPCGNSIVEAGEECDDGNLENTDECTEFCEVAKCTDGFQNADETDVDCGGHCGPHSCEPLQHCSTSEDCTGVCMRGICVPHSGDLVTGGSHTCALLDTGNVRCWGFGVQGQLGYGNQNTIGDDETPASRPIVDIGGTVVQLAAGIRHTCALFDTGAVRCWGQGAFGQLGYGNIETIGDNETPASAGNVDIGGTVVQISAGFRHTCALLDTGNVRCWGDGAFGQLGYGNTQPIGDDEPPASAGNVNVGGTVVQVSAGFDHTCALLDTGAVRCWGNGANGRLGYRNINNIGDSGVPATAGNVNIGGNVIQLSAGRTHTCALLDTGAVRCWGQGAFGQLGYGNENDIGDDEHPTSAGDVNVGGTVIQIAAGGEHTCALLDTGTVRCWGEGNFGRLGYGNQTDIGDTEPPAGDVNVGRKVIQLAVSVGGTVGADGTIWIDAHTCVVVATGAVRCWGHGYHGPLGYGNRDIIGDNEHPAVAGNVSIGGSVRPSAASLEVTRNLLDARDAQCWSDGVPGQLDRITPSYIAE